ncbi:flavin reductase family protein [Corticibacter populi]|uniref:Flavin reductase family protein n=1 Tax=Corticibacter populi TaxID=1550736 RepID=A0A3M6QX47_9BURK|nr:flavin reductase family protein [Corticibacter populi]RMX07578.1 flavin reductase family protein [Corticibacter populi]RZS30075.1 flavin reductase (DIM6/NTAB) family NADH-FMN oxidoreductase RutF [Corticibacter populi]
MQTLPLAQAFTLLEPGPVVLVTTHDGHRPNVMTISWTMVMDFTPVFAITTGPWNHSFAALRQQRECVIAIPTVDMLDTVVGIGTCSGLDTDKFVQFDLHSEPGRQVKAPLIGQCLANIECLVTDIIEPYCIVVLEAVAAHIDPLRKERRAIHAIGDGSFIVDGRKFDRRAMMASKLPPGV